MFVLLLLLLWILADVQLSVGSVLRVVVKESNIPPESLSGSRKYESGGWFSLVKVSAWSSVLVGWQEGKLVCKNLDQLSLEFRLLDDGMEIGRVTPLRRMHYFVSQKDDTGATHYNFNAHQPIFCNFWQMLLSEYAIEWWFVIPPFLTNVSALLGETWTSEIVFAVTVAKWVFAETTHVVGSKWYFAWWVVVRK